ncbi:hypothetical protein D6817_02300, partial [Candidatus Pacearchaeota archaeon]
MFGKLREKLSGWFRKAKKTEGEGKEEKQEVKKVAKRAEKGKKAREKKEKVKRGERKRVEEPEARKEEAEREVEESKERFEVGAKGEEEAEEEVAGEALGGEEERETGGFFSKLARKLQSSELKREEFDEMFEELEFALLENNVALAVVDKLKETIASELVGKRYPRAKVEEEIANALRKALEEVLIEPEPIEERIRKKVESGNVFVILFFGINGTGKTTTIAK